MGEGRAGVSGFVGVWFCFSLWVNHNKYRPFRVASRFQPFGDVLSEDFTAWQDTGGWGGRVPALMESFVQGWQAVECCDFFEPLLCQGSWPHYQYAPATQDRLPSMPHQSTQRGLYPNSSRVSHLQGSWWVWDCTGLCLCSYPSLAHPLCWLRYIYLQLSQWLRCLWFVCWTGNPLLNYGCPTYNFKRRDLQSLAHHHAADITPLLFCIESSILMRLPHRFFQGQIMVVTYPCIWIKMYKESTELYNSMAISLCCLYIKQSLCVHFFVSLLTNIIKYLV